MYVMNIFVTQNDVVNEYLFDFACLLGHGDHVRHSHCAATVCQWTKEQK